MLLLAKPISIHALREEGDTGHSLIAGDSAIFLSTPSARRATVFFQTHSWFFSYFYPRPPRGGRRAARVFAKSAMDFYPRPPRGGRLHRVVLLRRQKQISIHALREEGDVAADAELYVAEKFLSTPSARRATRRSEQSRHVSAYFYPRPPRGGRRLVLLISAGRIYFYPRPPRGGRPAPQPVVTFVNLFLSTPSARRATRRSEQSRHVSAYFYPRPPRGGRRLVLLISAGRIYFYPRPPRGGRPRLRVLDPFVLEISIHALREEGDDDPADDRIPIVVISIHALREEGDLMMLCSSVSAILFLSTPSARRATRAEKAAEAAREISIHALREEGDYKVWSRCRAF